MENIWNHKAGYSFFRPYVEWIARNCFSRVTVKGLENIPDLEKNSVLLAPNHCNTMMDSIMVLQSRKGPTAYLARADVFKNPKIARILHNLRILPVYRSRDGKNSAEKNVAIFDNVVECIANGVPVCIHPEGTHRARRSLLPLKKGVFRIALQSLDTYPSRRSFVVPVGLEYEDYYNIMCNVTVSFGEALEVRPGDQWEPFAETLASRISALITWFPDDENLAAREESLRRSRIRRYGPAAKVTAVLLAPVFALAAFLALPTLAVTFLILRRLKDKVWSNTVRFVCRVFLLPLTVIAAAIAGFIHLPWYLALALIAATVCAPRAFYRILMFYKRLRESNNQ